MFEAINWNWSFVGVAGLFLLSALITAGAQIQIRNAVAFGKIPVQDTNMVISMLGLSKWVSILAAIIFLVFMIVGFQFSTIFWWLAAGWLVITMIRGNNIVKMTDNPATGIKTVGPHQWQILVTQKAMTDPAVRKSLAEIMWLDQFLMAAVKENPSREIPEMHQAWSLCLQVARKLGLPEQEGADWLSYQATALGTQLGIEPVEPIHKVPAA